MSTKMFLNYVSMTCIGKGEIFLAMSSIYLLRGDTGTSEVRSFNNCTGSQGYRYFAPPEINTIEPGPPLYQDIKSVLLSMLARNL
jgi:hypothetical protein